MTDRYTVETEFCLSDVGHTPSRTDREQLVRQGVDGSVLAVLDTKFNIGLQTYTILDASGETFHSIRTNEPGLVVVHTIQAALQGRPLDLDQKKTLFGILEWQFECLVCHERKPAAAYDTAYLLWGSADPPQPHLRSGPCLACRAAARKSNGRQCGLVIYKVNAP